MNYVNGPTSGISKSHTQNWNTQFTRRHKLNGFRPALTLDGITMKYNSNPKILGITLDEKLLWNEHIAKISEQILGRLNLMKMVCSKTWGGDAIVMRQLYLQYIRPKMTYGCEVWGGAAVTHMRKLEKMQNCALRTCLQCPRTTSIEAMQIELNVQPLKLFIKQTTCNKFFKAKTLPSVHPLKQLHDNACKQSFTFRTASFILEQDRKEPREIPPVNPIPPWSWSVPTMETELPYGLTKQARREELKQVTMEVIKSRYENYLHIYTDGSLNTSNHHSGSSVFIPDLKTEYPFHCWHHQDWKQNYWPSTQLYSSALN